MGWERETHPLKGRLSYQKNQKDKEQSTGYHSGSPWCDIQSLPQYSLLAHFFVLLWSWLGVAWAQWPFHMFMYKQTYTPAWVHPHPGHWFIPLPSWEEEHPS